MKLTHTRDAEQDISGRLIRIGLSQSVSLSVSESVERARTVHIRCRYSDDRQNEIGKESVYSTEYNMIKHYYVIADAVMTRRFGVYWNKPLYCVAVSCLSET